MRQRPSASKSTKHSAGPAAGTAKERTCRGAQGCIHPGAQGANLLLLHQLLLALFLFILELLLQQVAKPEVLRGRVEGSVLWVRNRHLNSSVCTAVRNCLPWVASHLLLIQLPKLLALPRSGCMTRSRGHFASAMGFCSVTPGSLRSILPVPLHVGQEPSSGATPRSFTACPVSGIETIRDAKLHAISRPCARGGRGSPGPL